MTYLLDSTRAKIARAKKHLSELDTEIRAFHHRKPYRLEVDTDSKPGYEVYRFRSNETIPSEWGGAVGDVVHNLRSALDTLATALVVLNGKTSRDLIKNTYFPIGATKEVFDDKMPRDLKGASPLARRMIERLKPYKGGTDAFWRLHQLDILDKHTTLIPVGTGRTQIVMLFDFQRMFSEAFGDIPMPESDPSQRPGLILNPGETMFPLNDGDELFAYGFGSDIEGKFKPDFKFTFDIAFGEGQIIDGQPVIPTLKQFVDFVERVVAIFDRHLFRNHSGVTSI